MTASFRKNKRSGIQKNSQSAVAISLVKQPLKVEQLPAYACACNLVKAGKAESCPAHWFAALSCASRH
jgi:hypothetical protein